MERRPEWVNHGESMAVFRIADKPSANGRKKDEEDARREERGKTSAEDRTVRPSPGKAWDTPTGGADPTPRNMSRGVGGHSMGGGTRNETAGGARELFRRTIEQQRRSAQADLTVQREQQRQLGQAAQGLYSAYARQREAQQNMNGAITAGMTGNPIAAATGLTTPELAKKIDKSRLLNLQRATDNENLATLLEAGRITVQSNSELWGIDTKWLVDWLDEKADEARQRSGKQRARVTEGFPGSEKAGRYLVAGAHAAEDLVFLKLTGVSPKVPRMLRTFANGVESAQRQGKDTRAQIKQGLVGMAGNYLLKTLLRGYSLDEQDRQTAETALETLGNNEALITAMDTASPEQMAELTDAVSRALDRTAEEIMLNPMGADSEAFAGRVNELLSVDHGINKKIREVFSDLKSIFADDSPGSFLEEINSQSEEYSGLIPYKGYNENTGANGKTFVTNPFDSQGHLKQDVEYFSGEFDYHYQTDFLGRIERAFARVLHLTKRGKRLWNTRNTPGKRPGDHAGHLIADRFGGSNHLDNLISQSSRLNQSDFRSVENNWARALNRGGSVTDVEIQVLYNGNDVRPSGFVVKSVVDGSYQIINFNQ